MKTFKLFFLMSLLFSFYFVNAKSKKQINSATQPPKNVVEIRKKNKAVQRPLLPIAPHGKVKKDRSGHIWRRDISTEERLSLWQQVEAMPNDADERSVNQWQFVGPDRCESYSGGQQYVTGRIRSMEWMHSTDPTAANLIVGSASGGVWKINNYGSGWVPNSRQFNLNTPNIGHIAQHPTLEHIFLVGTGEPGVSSGTGMYRTTSSGGVWQSVTWPGIIPSSFSRIIFHPTNPDIVHAASSYGYYRSTDGGISWTQGYIATLTDMAMNFSNSNHLLVYAVETGLRESWDGGLTWNELNVTSFNPTNAGNVKLAFAPSQSNRVYATVCKPDGSTLGIFKSNDVGLTYTQCPTFPLDGMGNNYDYHWAQGGYNNCVRVHPTNSDIVMVGGGAVMKSTDGTNFEVILFTAGYHADVHSIVFSPTGSDLYVATDGGIYHSTDTGVTFNSNFNVLPVTQFYNIDVANNINNLIGSTQDNSTMSKRNDGGIFKWQEYLGSDGWEATRYDNNPDEAATVCGFPPESSPVYFTTDGGQNWSAPSLPAHCSGKYRKIRWERSNTIAWPYINSPLLACGNFVYYRDLVGNWNQMNSTAFPEAALHLTVSNRNTSQDLNNIYITMGTGSSSKIWKRSRANGNFVDISSGLDQSNNAWYIVSPHPKNYDEVYAIRVEPATKIYKSLNAGDNWIEITGNLPAMLVQSLAVHPQNSSIIVIGTVQFGVFRTDDGGLNWYRWENGIPAGLNVTSVEFIDSTAINGKAFCVMGTYGRGVWQREISGTDPVSVWDQKIQETNLIKNYAISNGQLQIELNESLSNFNATVMDMGGRSLHAVNTNASGTHCKIDVSMLSKGIYLFSVQHGDVIETKKVIIN